MKKLVLVMMIVATTISTLSKVLGQEVQLNWVQILSDENLSYTSGEIKILANGDVILVGTVYNVVEQQSDILLVRLDDKGDEVWSHLFGGEENEEGQSVVSLSTGGFLVGGSTTSYGNGEGDIFILRVEDDGDLLWQETYGSEANEGACRIREVEDGYIASGFRMSQNDPTLLLVKFDEYGELVWDETYIYLGELGITQCISIEPLPEGGYITSGIFVDTNDSLQSIVVELDSEGGVVWSKQISGEGSESIFDIKVLSNGYLLCGKSYLDTLNYFDAHILKLDLRGDVIWDRHFGSRNNEEFNQIALLDDGEFMLTGTITDDQNVSMPWVVQMSSWGDTLSSGIIPLDGTGKGVSITAKPNEGSVILSNTVFIDESELNSIQLVAYMIPCPIWYPRALQINNLWCTTSGNCYPNLPKIFTDVTGVLADSLLSYLQFNKINALLLGNLEDIFFEDVNGINNDVNVNGADLRDSLAAFISRVRSLSEIIDVVAVLRDKQDENNADTLLNSSLLDLLKNYNQTRPTASRFNEISIDYEFWRDQYGDPNNNDPILYPHLYTGWLHYRALGKKMKTICADTANHFYRISTILGRMDRNIDSNINTGLNGEDENVIVDFVDSTFSRVYLFFYIPDKTRWFISQEPTRFMTGWGDFTELAERIYHFGNNSTMSNIWPMFSAEDSVSVNDSLIYLGRWLQGSAGSIWAPQQHYLTEAQNIFRDQIFAYNIITANDFPGWQNSNKIDGYALFMYGLEPIDTLRIQDRSPNIYTNHDCFSARYFNSNTKNETEGTTTYTSTNSIFNYTDKYQVYTLLGQFIGLKSKIEFEKLNSGNYILTDVNSNVRFLINKQ